MANLAAVQRPISSLPIAAKIAVPGIPDWVAIDTGAVWISNAGNDSLARIDPKKNKVAKVVPVGRSPCSGLTAGFGSVWAPCCKDNRVDRVNVRTNRVEAHVATPIADSEGGIAAGEGAVWLVADRNGTLVRIDPAHNKINGQVKLAGGSFVPVVGAGSVWVSSTEHGLVSRVDPKRMSVSAEIRVGPAPPFMA